MLQGNSRDRRTVIMGCDSVGVAIATAVSDQGTKVYVIDPRRDAFELLPPGKIADEMIVPIEGDGTRQDYLRKASIGDARVFIALTHSDARNALAAQLAKHIFQVPTVICRIDNPVAQDVYNRLGMTAISATSLVTDMALEAAIE